MARTFASLIENGRMTIADVPKKHKAEVIDILKERGKDENGNPIKG